MVFRCYEQSLETILLSSETLVHKPPVCVSIYGIQRQNRKVEKNFLKIQRKQSTDIFNVWFGVKNKKNAYICPPFYSLFYFSAVQLMI